MQVTSIRHTFAENGLLAGDNGDDTVDARETVDSYVKELTQTLLAEFPKAEIEITVDRASDCGSRTSVVVEPFPGWDDITANNLWFSVEQESHHTVDLLAAEVYERGTFWRFK